jgi:hypothetical protein
MKANRNITLKSNVTPDEFLTITAHAAAVKKSVSTHIRDCCLPCPDVNRTARPATRTSLGPFRAKLLPGRQARRTTHLRS